MSARNQLLLSAALVAVAAAVVALVTMGGGPTDGGEQSHDHASSSGAGDARSPVRLDAAAARRIGVAYATAERKVVDHTVRTVGTVTYDETRIVDVNPKIEGWVERLYVDFTGAPVRRGQPLLALYSPMLVSAQEELILARRLLDESAAEPGSRTAERARQLLEAARRRLAYWDIPAGEIRQIEETGAPTKTLTLTSPASGFVVEKSVFEGGRIGPGMNLYRIADLSTVWVDGEVFEKDLGKVRQGQAATVTVDAYPDQRFAGRVAVVGGTVDPRTRTVPARVEVANADARLKLDMFARIDLATDATQPGLAVRREAVQTLEGRQVVFVKSGDTDFMVREVDTGRLSGPLVEITRGLAAGDVVVTAGAFKLKSALLAGTLADDDDDDAKEPQR